MHKKYGPTRTVRVHHSEIIDFLKNATDVDKKKSAKFNSSLQGELANTLRDTMDRFDNLAAEDAAQFIMWHDLWLDFGTYGIKRNTERRPGFSFNKWDRGHIVSVDFGLNIGKEFSLLHPGIIVGSYIDFVVVVPLTGDEEHSPKTYPADIDGSMLRVKKEDPLLKDKVSGDQIKLFKDSIAMVPHVRCISKNRIRNNMRINILNTPFFEKVEETLYKQLCEGVSNQHQETVTKLEQDLENLKVEHSKELETLRVKMQATINELHAQLGALVGQEAAAQDER